MNALDIFSIHLREQIGTRKVALMYIICDEFEPARLGPVKNDQITSVKYTSLMEEMIARSPLGGNEYHKDSAKVYQIF